MVSVINQTDRTATVTLIMQRLSASLFIRWGEVAAVTVLVIVPTILLFSFIQSRLVAGMTAGAIREE
jgi:ABC-type glycerol-3-phosphate transport system permease component